MTDDGPGKAEASSSKREAGEAQPASRSPEAAATPKGATAAGGEVEPREADGGDDLAAMIEALEKATEIIVRLKAQVADLQHRVDDQAKTSDGAANAEVEQLRRSEQRARDIAEKHMDEKHKAWFQLDMARAENQTLAKRLARRDEALRKIARLDDSTPRASSAQARPDPVTIARAALDDTDGKKR